MVLADKIWNLKHEKPYSPRYFSFCPILGCGFSTCKCVPLNFRFNVELNVNDWLSMLWQDALGLLPSYGVIIAITLLLAFLTTHFAIKRFNFNNVNTDMHSKRLILFALAGGLSFLLMLLAMQPILNVTLIAGARSTLGLLAQCTAGMCAGAVYSKLSNSFNNY